MSAILSRPRRPNTPPLPPELWLLIFTFATWAPRDAEAYICRRAPSRGHWWGMPHPDLRSAFVTKRYLVRVCREWQALSMPLLFEHIIIRRMSRISSLGCTLEASRREAESTDNGRSLGWWTKRLDIAVQDFTTYSDFTRISDIIRCLPNLTVIVFSASRSSFGVHPTVLPMHVLDALSETCSHTLQDIFWTTNFLIPDMEDWHLFLPRMPRLRRLGCPYTRSMKLTRNPMTPAFISPSVTGMVITALSSEINTIGDDINHFPALQDLLYVLRNAYEHSMWQPLLQVSGHTLTRVALSVYGGRSLREELILVKRFCPNLIRLDLALRRWADLSPACDIPTVIILGLHCYQLRAKSHDFNNLFDVLYVIRPPSLKAVRFLDHRIVDNIRDHHPRACAIGIDRLAVRGCKVEDHEGVCILLGQQAPAGRAIALRSLAV